MIVFSNENIKDVDYDLHAIRKAIEQQMAHGKYGPSFYYYKQDTSKRIRKVLKTVPLYTQKRFFDGASM